MEEGLDELLFNLLLLGSISNRDGSVRLTRRQDYFIIESMPLLRQEVVIPSPFVIHVGLTMCNFVLGVNVLPILLPVENPE